MSPKEYYYNQFSNDLRILMTRVKVGGDSHLHIVELFLDRDKKHEDKLALIPSDRLAYFLSALALTILVDQVMYTYFKSDYEKFRSMTLYPKITWNIGWCANVKPWQLFEHRIALVRGLRNPEKIERFKEFSEFFVSDLQDFFKNNKFEVVSWDTIRLTMLNDNDIITTKYGDGNYGEIFKNALS